MFIKLTETFCFNGVPIEAIRLHLFPFSLSGRAADWLENLANDSITTWEELMNLFLTKFYPPTKTSQMRQEITNFGQQLTESLYKAYKHFRRLLKRCLHHNIPDFM